MSTPLALVATGSYISDGAARTIQFPKLIDYFIVRNRSTWGTAPTAIVESTWYRGYAAGQATHFTEGGASAVTATATAAGGAGFTEVDQRIFTDGAAIAITAITAATPAVVATATTPVVGNIVRIINPTAMLQIGGLEFTVTAVTAGVNFTLGYLPAAGFAAAATGGTYRVINDVRYLPRRRWITAITAANPAVITTSIAHGYVVGDRITVYLPDANFGMTQINGLSANVTAVTASTITTDINAAAFTAFAYPTSAVAAAGVSFPHVVPVGETPTKVTSATDNQSLFGLQLGTAVVGANTNVMDWMAFSREYTI
jgi:hypothetical protein